jgi:uncharacterized protein YgiB involved in biofilm formation
MRSNLRGRVGHALAIACGLTAFGLGMSQDAFAQTIPNYATSVHCQRVAGFGGAFSRSIYGSCLNVEQNAALALQARWSSLSTAVRERCDRIANFGGSGSYSILQNCVDVELAAPVSSGPPAAGGIAKFYLVVTSEGGQGTPYNTLAECLEARAKATQTAICINRCCLDVEPAAPASSGPPGAEGVARFYLVTSEGGQGTSYKTLAECLEARAKAAQTAFCVNR